MRSDLTRSVTGFALLGVACAVSFLLPDALTVRSVTAQAAPDSYTLRGVVRDFLSTHPDFGLATTPSLSTIAGNVDPYLDPSRSPKALSKVQSNGSNGMSTANVTISKWGFDGGGATVNDNKGGHDGTIMNGATREKGIFGKAMAFDGVDDYVEVPHHADFMLDTATVTFWFNAQDTAAQQVMVGKDAIGYGSGGHLTCFLENGLLKAQLQSTTTSYIVQSAPGSIVPDTWHHVGVSFGSGGLLLYLDNERVDTDPYTGGLGTSSGGTGNVEPWTFGAGNWTGGSGAAALDQFNSVSYGGSDGSKPWTGSWVESFDDGSAATGTVRVESGHLHVDNSDGGTGPTMRRGVDLSGATAATLQFDFGGYGTGPVDIFAVEASDDGGASFVVLESISVIGNVSDSRSYDLQNFISLTGNVVVQIRLVQGFMASGQHFTIDNARVGETTSWSDPFGGLLDEVQIFTGQIADTEYKATGGYLVGDHTKNGNGDNIAPHLYGDTWCSDGSSPAPCFDPSTDVAGTQGNTGSGQVSSTESFDDWFNDVIGMNMSTQHTIDMVKDLSGVYEYSNMAFDPVGGDLLGNESNSTNANFTYAIEATFTYEECTEQFFEFQGGDGAWLFIDGRLALDMGGIATNNHQLIELDRMCLQDGQDYSFHFFYANRQAIAPEFTLRTNVWLRQSLLAMMLTQPFD